MDRTSDLLQVRLLGGFELRSGHGRDAPPLGRKVRALLACLALSSGKPWLREKLMALLWSDRGEEQARASLRQALAELRRAFGEPSPLRAEHDAISLDPAMIALDAVEFERLAKSGRLDEAAALYRGPLLDGHGVRDDAFEEWLGVERGRLHDLAVDLLDRLAASQSGDAAIKTTQRLLQLDPAREETHRLLMRLYAAAGQRAQALRQYQQCRDALQRELQAQPDIETERLYRQIQDDPRPAAVTSVGAVRPDPAPSPDSKPSIAVLPFANMSGDPEQEYFSDGITEDIITELSRFRSLFVIARNSSFQYKGNNVDVRKVGRELGVQYVVEGSVRKMANRVRISAQLIDTVSGNHLWSERYDRALDDIFAVQDEVLHSIVARLERRLASSIIEQARRKPTERLAAYDCVLQARQYLVTYSTEAAEPLIRRAIDLDPNYAAAYAALALVCLVKFYFDSQLSRLDESLNFAQKAVALDPNDAACLSALGRIHIYRREFDEAGLSLERALALNPSDTDIIAIHAHWLSRVGRHEEALASLELVLLRDPFPPSWYSEVRSVPLLALKRYEEAIDAVKRRDPLSHWSYAYMAACYAHLGRMDDARSSAAKVLQMRPDFTIRMNMLSEPFKNAADSEHEAEGLRKAGLPE